MEKLWSTANIRLYRSSVEDDRFHRRLPDLIGSYDRAMTSETHSRGSGRERSRARPLTLPDDTAETPAAMIEPQPWYTIPALQPSSQAPIDNYAPAASTNPRSAARS